MPYYVYAVGRSDDGPPPPVRGIFDIPLRRLDSGRLCAIVSDCPAETVRAERRNLMAVQRALSTLNASLDLLPVAFGAIAKTKADIRRFIDERQDEFEAQLRRVAGAVEMNLRLTLDAPDPIAYLVERTPQLKAARERIFNARRKPSHDEKIRLGQMVEAVLNRYREAHAANVMTALGDSCAELIKLPARSEKEIVNLAALAPRCALDRFEAAVHDAAARTEEDIAFDLSGPWPPFNFVQVEAHEC